MIWRITFVILKLENSPEDNWVLILISSVAAL
jgi:hypothetical protein